MYIREGIYTYIYYIWGRLGFEGILNADWIWKLIFFFFFLGRLYQRILNWKFWRIVNLKESIFFITLPSIFQGKNVSWNFRIEVCRTVLKVIPRIARDWRIVPKNIFDRYYPILYIEKFLDRYLVNNFSILFPNLLLNCLTNNSNLFSNSFFKSFFKPEKYYLSNDLLNLIFNSWVIWYISELFAPFFSAKGWK